MHSWRVFAQQRPDIATLGSRILSKYGISYLATVRRDGGPRVHPVCPVVLDGQLIVGIIPSSPKRHDLDRDGRYVLHALPGPNDAEFSAAGRARRMSADEVGQLAERAGPRVRLSPDSVMYELLLRRVDVTTYTPGPDNVPVPTRGRWPEERTST